MNEVLTKDQLTKNLYKLKNALCSYDYRQLDNIIFFNNDVVYEYLCGIETQGGFETVGEVLEKICGYIPIRLTDDSLKFLMESATNPEELERLDDAFLRKNNMEFMQMIAKIDNTDDWENILNLCETIRSYRVKEEEYVLK